MSINYFCSGFDINNAFWKELSDRFKSEKRRYKKSIYSING